MGGVTGTVPAAGVWNIPWEIRIVVRFRMRESHFALSKPFTVYTAYQVAYVSALLVVIEKRAHTARI